MHNTKQSFSYFQVVALARRKSKVEELIKGYEGRLFTLKVDLTKEVEILNAFKWIEENVEPISVFVNNAGVNNTEDIETAETRSWQIMLDTNLMAVGICTREAIKNMKTNGVNGFIINLNSIAGHYIINFPGVSMYQASKYGVTAFTESVRLELAKEKSKIRITVSFQ